MTALTLLKYHGLGNDFLVVCDETAVAAWPEDAQAAELARRLCDRHRGIGADGLIVARPARHCGEVAMELRNSDGGLAETSGNGLRCFALALVESGKAAGPAVRIETAGGPVTATVGEQDASGCADVAVTMGRATVGGAVSPAPGLGQSTSARSVEIGNPHLVVFVPDLSDLDISVIGPPLEAARPGGQNVEAVALRPDGGLDLVVWERGAGVTEACGSGSCAAAAAARASGAAGDRVEVHNPGGVLVVDLAGPLEQPDAVLSGPACRVARIEVDLAAVHP